MDKFGISQRFSHVTENLWSTYKALADKYAKVNLGQGAPDYNPSDAVVTALRQILQDADDAVAAAPEEFATLALATHQYAPLAGHRQLVAALAQLYGREFGREIAASDGSISVGVGAQGCLTNVFAAFVNPGDEVIVIEPFYDCYPSLVIAAGGRPVFVPLRPRGSFEVADNWQLDAEELAAAFSPRTKLLVLNTPHNPLGKVFSWAELTALAKLCQRHNVVCVSDEVYEWMVLAGRGERARIAVVPGMWERTLTIGSAGKCFNVTGWRVGWCVGPPALISHVTTVQAEMIYSVTSPLQAAVARMFEAELRCPDADADAGSSVLRDLRDRIRENRDLLAEGLARIGVRCVLPSGGCFMLVEVKDLPRPTASLEGGQAEEPDVAVVKHLTREFGLATIPCSPFFSPEHRGLGRGFLRVCINKRRETVLAGLKLLEAAVTAERCRRQQSAVLE